MKSFYRMVDFSKHLRKKVLVVDGQHLAYRAYYRFSSYRTDDGVPSGLAFGVPYMLESLVRKFKADEVHIAFDKSRSKHRLQLLPSYKDRRKKLDFNYESFQAQLQDTMSLLQNWGCYVYYGGEADDTLYRILRKRRKKREYITLISGDKDFVQLLEPKYKYRYVIKIYNPNKDAIVTPSNSLELYGYTPTECVSWLALDGDKSDNIPGVRGYGKVKIRKFLDEYGTVEKYIADSQSHADYNKILDLWPINKLLIDLDKYYLEYGKDEQIPIINNTLGFSADAVRAFANKYQLTSILKDKPMTTMKGLVI